MLGKLGYMEKKIMTSDEIHKRYVANLGYWFKLEIAMNNIIIFILFP